MAVLRIRIFVTSIPLIVYKFKYFSNSDMKRLEILNDSKKLLLAVLNKMRQRALAEVDPKTI